MDTSSSVSPIVCGGGVEDEGYGGGGSGLASRKIKWRVGCALSLLDRADIFWTGNRGHKNLWVILSLYPCVFEGQKARRRIRRQWAAATLISPFGKTREFLSPFRNVAISIQMTIDKPLDCCDMAVPFIYIYTHMYLI